MKNLRKKLGRPRLLIVGCGDVGMRCLPWLRERFRVFALTSQPARAAELRMGGAVPIIGNLDHPRSLRRVGRLAERVFHLAPPPNHGRDDSRTRHLLAALNSPARPRAEPDIVPEPRLAFRRSGPAGRTLIYASTTGVYGDCAGQVIDETRPVHPESPRAIRRVAAERRIRRFGQPGRPGGAGATGLRTRAAWRASRPATPRTAGWRSVILRIPGIYADNRLPLARLQRRTPALRAEDDVYTNHIHADDLARIFIRALWRGRAQRIVHASDDTCLKMGDYFDAVADALTLPRPPRISRVDAGRQLEPALLSFMRESRLLDNGRLKRELGYALRYRTVDALLETLRGKVDVADVPEPGSTTMPRQSQSG